MIVPFVCNRAIFVDFGDLSQFEAQKVLNQSQDSRRRPARTIWSMQRIDSLLLASIGVLLVHQVAYMASALLGYEASVAHGHMAIAWFGGSLATLCVLARAITHSLKKRSHTSPNDIALFAAIAADPRPFERVLEGLRSGYAEKEQAAGAEGLRRFEKYVMLQSLDKGSYMKRFR